ncbi:ABC transporter substrate-binding protein [Lacrimispora algidixylanolytica]|uniref:ABC transporter substrate-binding protein n=1 Tax=Lacrimispora algidixylanolytica TaxID=94868 RepID=A0A419T5H7_9FIRM|nr:extracellular solute-binding protein [Lacrimispora algidixylanolytica]RKD32686.1 ABC transporter substrate-binding protein [Lacrimispora algidixylanolytica]
MKKRMLKGVSAVMLSAALVVSMAGCAGKSSTAPAGGTGNDKVVLNVWHQWSNDTNELKKKYDEAVAAYIKDNPNVEINTQTLDTEAYKTKISAEFAGDAKGIDLFYYWGAGTARKMVNADKLLPLDSYLTDEVKGKLLEGSTAAFEYNGSTYSLPMFSWYMTLYCNKALFEQAGAELPETYDQLVTAVDKLSKLDGVTPLASGAKDGWNAAFIYQALALRSVGSENINKMLSGKAPFEGDGYKDAADKVAELYKKGAFGANPLEQSNDDANAAFGSGKAAMRLMGSWYANSIYSDKTVTIKPEDVVAMKIPMISGKGNAGDYCGGFVESFWVNKSTKNPDQAAKFAIYINEKMGEAAYASGTGFSGWKTEVDDKGLNPLFVQIKGLLSQGTTAVLAWDTSLDAEPATIHNEQVQTLFAPNADTGEFIKEHEAAINK